MKLLEELEETKQKFQIAKRKYETAKGRTNISKTGIEYLKALDAFEHIFFSIYFNNNKI
jgi:hypothetical protein